MLPGILLSASVALLITPSEDIAAHCEVRGGETVACTCVAAQAEARFDADQLELVALAMDPNLARAERAAALQASGATPQSLSEVTRAMVLAEPEIQQVCGAGLLRARPR